MVGVDGCRRLGKYTCILVSKVWQVFLLPAKLAKVVAVTVHEVEGGQVDNEDEAGQQDETQ